MSEQKFAASVKVMRSHDYCHFEVALSNSEPMALSDIDAMRKEAARLADKAVTQYKVAKKNANTLLLEKSEREHLQREVERIRQKSEGDLTVSEQAKLKAFDDASWAASRRYDYEDDWGDDAFDE